jgi:hypothetical protein
MKLAVFVCCVVFCCYSQEVKTSCVQGVQSTECNPLTPLPDDKQIQFLKYLPSENLMMMKKIKKNHLYENTNDKNIQILLKKN